MKEVVVRKACRVLSPIVSLALVSLLGGGCARPYFQNRLNDTMDLWEMGVTVSKKPGVAVFSSCYSLLPIGYSHVEGKEYGWGNRQAGWMDFRHKSWGVVVYSCYDQLTGKFNPNDPYQARRDQSHETDKPRFNTGIIGVTTGNCPPLLMFFECDRTIHLGWVGIHLKYRVPNIVDWVVGWTTLDLFGDDLVAETPPVEKKAAAEKKAIVEKK